MVTDMNNDGDIEKNNNLTLRNFSVLFLKNTTSGSIRK